MNNLEKRVLRQAHVIAATMIFFGFSSFYLSGNQSLLIVALLPGFGLALSGLTGFCPMTFMLQKLPFNKN